MNKITLITFQGEHPLFRDTEKPDFKAVNQRTFSDKFREFSCVQSLKFTWEKSAEYLEKIAEKKDFKKVRKAALKVAAADLNFNLDAQAPQMNLDQKIKMAYKGAKLTPKMK